MHEKTVRACFVSVAGYLIFRFELMLDLLALPSMLLYELGLGDVSDTLLYGVLRNAILTIDGIGRFVCVVSMMFLFARAVVALFTPGKSEVW